VQEISEPILTIGPRHASYDMFLRRNLPFGGRDDCTCVNIFSGVDFFNRD